MAVAWTDGTFVTGPHSRATTVITEGERIVAVGGAELLDGLPPGTRVERLGGRTVTAGLWDSHVHLGAMAEAAGELDLSGAGWETVLQRVAERAAAAPAGAWIRGRGWNQNGWGGPEPHRRHLDRVAPRHPVALWARDHHVLWLNSTALAALEVSATVPASLAALVDRDADGPTGVVREQAAARLAMKMGGPRPRPADLQAVFAHLTRLGLVGATAMEAPETLEVLARVPEALPFRVVAFLMDGEGAGDDSARPARLRAATAEAPAWVTIKGWKFFMDGALGMRTAWLSAPYADVGHQGVARLDRESLLAAASPLWAGGWSVAVHAIGDAAVHEALAALGQAPAPGLARIEHAQLVLPGDLVRFSAARVTASMQAVHLLEDRRAAERAWGARARWAFPCRSLIKRGVPVTLGSDAPVETADPVRGMEAAVWRARRSEPSWYPEEGLSPWEALRAYTAVPAMVDGRPMGSIAPGYLADFTVFDQDPLMALARREPPSVTGTVRGGQFVYRSEA
jgi:predicted amidohydrolase YtcJ